MLFLMGCGILISNKPPANVHTRACACITHTHTLSHTHTHTHTHPSRTNRRHAQGLAVAAAPASRVHVVECAPDVEETASRRIPPGAGRAERLPERRCCRLALALCVDPRVFAAAVGGGVYDEVRRGRGRGRGCGDSRARRLGTGGSR